MKRVGELTARPPTAVQAGEAVQETPASAPLPPGVGVACRSHAIPFQDSASVTEAPDPLLKPA